MAHPLIPEVQKLVNANPVMVFMKGTAEFPACGFSAKACSVLKAAGVEKVASFDLLSDDDMWAALEELTEWPTSPQVFIKGQFIGGCDIVGEMYENGELQQLLKN